MLDKTVVCKRYGITGKVIEETETHVTIEFKEANVYNGNHVQITDTMTVAKELVIIIDEDKIKNVIKEIKSNMKDTQLALTKLWYFEEAMIKQVIPMDANLYKKYTVKQLNEMIK